MAESSPNGKKTVGKGETARYEQFLLFPQCFQKTRSADMKKTRACFGKGLCICNMYQPTQVFTVYAG